MSELVTIKLPNGSTASVTREYANGVGAQITNETDLSSAEFSGEGAPVSVGAGTGTQIDTADVAADVTADVASQRYADQGARALVGTALSTATLGLSDVVAKHVFNVNMEKEDAIRAQNPGDSTVGAIVGLLPALATGGGASLLARGASYAPVARAARAGEAVSKAVGGGVRGMAAAGATEGAAMAAMQTLSDMTVGRKDFSTEALLSDIGYNAILGGAVGGALGGVAKGAGKLAGKFDGAAEGAAKNADEVAFRDVSRTDDGFKVAESGGVKMKASKALQEQKKAQNVFKQAMNAASEDLTVNMAVTKNVAAEYDQFLSRWDTWNRRNSDLLESAGFRSKKFADEAEMLKAVESGASEGVHASFSKAFHKSQYFNAAKRELAAGNTERFIEILEEQKQHAARFAAQHPKAAAVIEQLDVPYHLAAQIDPNYSVKMLAKKVRENPLWAARTEEELNTAINSMAEFKVAAAQFRGVSKKFDGAMSKLDEALVKFDPEAGYAGVNDVDAVKDRLAKVWARERMIEAASSTPGVARRAWDKLKDKADGNLLVGAVLGGGLDGAMGALGLGVLMRSDAVKGMLKYGARKGLGAASKLDSPIIRRSIVAQSATKPAERKKYIQQEEANLAAVMGSDDAVAASLRNRVPELFVSNQMLSTAITRAKTAATYLASKLPGSGADKSPFGLGSKYVPGDAEFIAYEQAKAVAANPMHAVGKFADGRISPDEADAFRTMWPEMHAELVKEAISGLGEVRDTMSYARQVSLSILLGVPVASALKPETLAAIQASYTQPQEGSGGPEAGPSKQAENEATKAQQLAK